MAAKYMTEQSWKCGRSGTQQNKILLIRLGLMLTHF